MDELEFLKGRLSLAERLINIKQKQIDSLLDISRSINSNLPITALVRVYQNILLAQLGVRHLAFFIRDENDHWQCIENSTSNADILKIHVDSLIHGNFNVIPVQRLNTTYAEEFEYLIPVFHKKHLTGYAFISKLLDDSTDTTDEKLKFVQTITNIVVVANENKKLVRKQVDQMVLQKELSMAADMQNLLVPTRLPKINGVEADKFYKPHKSIGGDYFDMIKISEDEFFFCISDISGKGIPAALLMANFQACVRILLQIDYPMEDFTYMLNKKILEATQGEKYITMFAGRYNAENRRLTYVNAGHLPSILYNNGNYMELEKGCTILGMFPNFKTMEIGEVTVEPGSYLVNFTDGITESANMNDVMYEADGILNLLKSKNYTSPSDFNRRLIDDLIKFKQSTEFDDDLTLLTIFFK